MVQAKGPTKCPYTVKMYGSTSSAFNGTECISTRVRKRGNSASLRAGAFRVRAATERCQRVRCGGSKKPNNRLPISPSAGGEAYAVRCSLLACSSVTSYLFTSSFVWVSRFRIQTEIYCRIFFFMVQMTRTGICMLCHNFQTDQTIIYMGNGHITNYCEYSC